MNAIETQKLTKCYGNLKAVDGIDLQVRQGELFSLLGVNGAGKTTTVRMLCGLVKPTSGDACLGGCSVVTETAQVKRIIALSPQETAVAPNLTVEENLLLMAGIHGISKDSQKQKLQTMMETLGLAPVRKQRAGKLSGGWQRRLSIAMALICQPQILFLDEPTLGLDVLARSPVPGQSA